MKVKTLSKKEIKTLGLSSLGGTLEFYDFIIFVFFANIISEHFFPDSLSETWKIINTYGIFATGYLARPLGGIVMAHFGDKFGRKNMFMLSILLMVIPTFALALVPTFETIGYVAPLFLIFVRICQGIAVGGELPGAWVFIHEHAPDKQKNTYLGFLTASVTAGILLGSLVYLLTYMIFEKKAIEEWAWRVPFALGGVFGIISVYLRRFLEETPVFQQMKQDSALVTFPLKEVFKSSKFGVVVSMLVTWVLTGCILVFILLMPNFISKMPSFNLDAFEKTYFQISGLVCIVSGIILSGVISDKIKPYKVCIAFSIVFGVFSFLFFKELYSSSPSQVSTIGLYCLTCFGAGIMNFCPVFMSDVFKPHIRFSGISFAYNIAYAIAGGFTPQLAAFFHNTALKEPASLMSYGLSAYVLVLAFVAFSTSLLMRRMYEKA
ncbi:MFS transporter [Campylobacter sp. MIT 97-5078]|uniref:MFS transporter n=1 Tax=Campylobacter sp. MIT 97-5078 TaxID=1548153 RepID=UPI0005129895|nr:MFS transporter [Campylobacter sp. MIT 97-5078]KGI55472.1 integrase [Campylobacter sp. MIT 97-5078]TQR27047.1 MFS transporter [Campylobacter sp. MIT 97-5078]